MNKAERLFQLVTYMRSRRTAVTAQELAQRLNVSERTIYRDMQSLVLSGVPVEGEAGVGYLLNSDTTIAPLMFTEAEIEAIVLGMRLVKSWADDEMIASADQAMTKIRSVISEPLMHRLNHRTTPFIVPEYGRTERVRFGEQIRQAIHQDRTVQIEYADAQQHMSERELEPLGLVFWGTSWTLAAWCCLREQYRSFRLDRIKQLVITDRTINRHHTLQDYLTHQGDDVNTEFWAI
ncbi:YafY family protein [Reinekea sp. G2M2-21]|uniref:helix-turn-helix transcriptional regulator n=1 Tax=Reinekea sp. G2M2-21 TaxID=2788942 RepID=UPI0018A8CF07|nr:YafY family protein [Reinekea sp. G2M2-21]